MHCVMRRVGLLRVDPLLRHHLLPHGVPGTPINICRSPALEAACLLNHFVSFYNCEIPPLRTKTCLGVCYLSLAHEYSHHIAFPFQKAEQQETAKSCFRLITGKLHTFH
jgi:hypothetical protein